MKTKNLLFFGIFFVAAILLGCQNNSELSYTVWTDVSSYSDYEKMFNDTLYDGYYKYLEFSNEQFSQMESILAAQNDYRHNWTEEELQKYFVGRGFDSKTASETVAWLVTVNHGFVASRSGDIVYYILK